jgi:hypothetical protein
MVTMGEWLQLAIVWSVYLDYSGSDTSPEPRADH